MFIVLAYAVSKGTPHILVVFAPIALVQFLIASVNVVMTTYNFRIFASRHPVLSQMRVKHIFILGFVYALGYFVPTLLLIQEYGNKDFFIQDMIVSNLAYDMIFTVVLSICLLNRRMLRVMRWRLVLPITLCLLAIYVSEHLEYVDRELQVNVTGREQYILKECYMYLMSRFCFCFVNVASKLFMFKETAFQKAWSIASEEAYAAELEADITEFNKANDINYAQEQVPNRERMRYMVSNSPFKSKQKELFDFYSYLCINMYDLELMGAKSGPSGRIPGEWDEAKMASDHLNVAY